MENRGKAIYQEVFQSLRTKDYLAHLYDVSTKTIENTIARYCDDIVYDRKLGAYRFHSLLPKYISFETFFDLFQNSIGNKMIRNDFIEIGKFMSKSSQVASSMIDTSVLSTLAQNMLKSKIAINHNCILKIEYSGNSKPMETKYIRPHTIIFTGQIYYLYCSYDKKNKKDIDKNRSMAFNGIHTIEAVEYSKNDSFKKDVHGNAYGLFSRDKFVTLKLMQSCAIFFKREGLLTEENFDFVSEDLDGSILVKMYYNDTKEIVNLMQQWMPQISIQKNSELKTEVYEKIQANFEALVGEK